MTDTIVHPFPFEHPAYHYRRFERGRDGMEGERYWFKFTNGYGASVIRHTFSYGYENGQWELAVTDHGQGLIYSTPITDDVIGRLDDKAVALTLDAIARLPFRK